MSSQAVVLVIFSVLFVWLVVLTALYYKAIRHYRKITISDDASLEEAINTIFKGLDELHTMITGLTTKVEKLETQNKAHVSKLFLKRFNPFGDTGSNQSFSLVLLDGNNDGAVLSSLHGRSGTRIYAKPVKSGKQADYELSTEEKEVLSLAVKEN